MVEIEKGYMAYDFYQAIIQEIRPFTSAVTLAVNGESLLHPHFFEMVRYATDQGIKVLLNTNGTLLNHERAELLLDSGIKSISFAFDGFNKSMYEKARVGASYEKTLTKILHFLKLKKKRRRRYPYSVLSILMLELERCPEEEKRSFLGQFDGLIDEIRLREVSTWGSTFKDTKKFSYRENRIHHTPCSRLWSTAVITWNGDVVPCIYNVNHEYVLGNLKKKRFPEIWNGEKMISLRRSMLNGSYLRHLPLCENCIVLGTPPIYGIPSGIRLTLADSATNMVGYGFEKFALAFANRVRNGRFTARTINH